jgi:hypothetical protein
MMLNDIDRFRALADTTGVPLFNVPGNHEMQSDPAAIALLTEKGHDLYGSFDVGPWHFVGLNTDEFCLEGRIHGEQLEWLRGDLAEHASGAGTFVFMHRPMYSWFQGDFNPNDQELLRDLFAEHGVKGVFAAHDHFHHVEEHRGVPYMTVAGAGSPMYAQPTRGGFAHYVLVSVGPNGVGFNVVEPGASTSTTSPATTGSSRSRSRAWPTARTATCTSATSSSACHGSSRRTATGCRSTTSTGSASHRTSGRAAVGHRPRGRQRPPGRRGDRADRRRVPRHRRGPPVSAHARRERRRLRALGAHQLGHPPRARRGIVTSASAMVRHPGARRPSPPPPATRRSDWGCTSTSGSGRIARGRGSPCTRVVDLDDRDAVERETRAQLERFRDLARRDPDHLDSHQHVHAAGAAREVAADLAAELGVPLREHTPGIAYRGGFYGRSGEGEPYPAGISVETLVSIVRSLPEGVTELACHPGEAGVDDPGYGAERELELRALCDDRVKQALAEAGSAGDVRVGDVAPGRKLTRPNLTKVRHTRRAWCSFLDCSRS